MRGGPELRQEELARVERQIRAIIEAVKKGLRTPSMKDELLALEARKAELGRELASPLLRWLSLTSRRSVDNDPKNWRAQPPPKPDPGTYIQVAFRLSRISADGARLQKIGKFSRAGYPIMWWE